MCDTARLCLKKTWPTSNNTEVYDSASFMPSLTVGELALYPLFPVCPVCQTIQRISLFHQEIFQTLICQYVFPFFQNISIESIQPMASTAVTDTDGLKVKLTDGFQENLQKLEAVILSGPIWKVLRSVFLSHSHVISHEPDYLFTL